ncbi:MAG TPA: ABC transporter ATP-binding protein [Pseudonocardiaceae bacterium]|nr:ABC transporter ATP-binding protein [Pseudonocardiaceae bacterium]
MTGSGWASTALRTSQVDTEPVLDIRGLTVDYGVGDGAVHAASEVDLVLHRGEVLGLAGESGSGKSTLAYAVTRLLRPPGVITGGEAWFHTAEGGEVDLLAADAEQLRKLRWSEIAVVFQSAMHALNPVMTVGAQLTDVLEVHRPHLSRHQRRERAVELLRMVGITGDRLGSYPHQLSGGMRQRVMIAMAVACDPKVLIADEPTTALDVTIQAGVLEVIRTLCRTLDTAVLLITHDLGVVAEVADRVVVMYAGRPVEQASVGSLFAEPQHPYTMGLMGALPANALRSGDRRLAEIPGLVPAPVDDPDECQFAPRCPRATEKCRTERPLLRELGTDHSVACHHPGREVTSD